jgi:hypothetical protein
MEERRNYIRYRDELESRDPDEPETTDQIIAAMQREGEITRERYGRAIRTSHAKAHGLLYGELRVLDGLPEALRQGLFASPRTYRVIARLAHVPGELLDDRRVSTPRGMAINLTVSQVCAASDPLATGAARECASDGAGDSDTDRWN